ncbi:Outer membrane assembly protein [Sodalis praecaptivus]|uniref:Outer membrane assembly protein n=1 Tax=Sodalis praecaptivus TaxID=1239307 RepID=K7STQ1_9GAMM|nr:outer membrane assembly protein AsmA [Sodalis praecaptivus]AFW03663.1 Outer membrane assembly protein [Sodalis praecaptivus]AHF76506.1 Outer membrane assembly protein [Sodalis praecaptivus]
MRRLLTTLFILLVVVVAGLTAMVALINPNDFRSYMITQVEQRSGYHLALEGDLRWHAWPQLSILAGRMKLTAPGAKLPLVSAENMRLDVALWPLLSHQLSVKQVMLKGAVITLTPDSAARRPENAPIAPAGTPEPEEGSGWSWNIGSLQVADSLLIWQRDDNEQLNLRDLNLQMKQDDARKASIEFSGRLNRDQRDLTVSLNGSLDLSQYPRQLSAHMDKFSYRLRANGLPEQGIEGEGAFNADYSAVNQSLTLGELTFSANDSELSGQISARLGDAPVYQLDLAAKTLNLDTLLGLQPPADGNDARAQNQSATTGRPVIANSALTDNALSNLNDFSGQLSLRAQNVIYHGLTMTDFNVQADNRRGQLSLNTFTGKLGEGEFNLPGTLDATGKQPLFHLHPQFSRVALGPLLKAFALPQTLTGQLSLQGEVWGHNFTAMDFARGWQGSAAVTLDNAKLEGLNISQLIQRAVTRTNGSVAAEERDERYSQVRQLTANATLNQGNLRLDDLAGDSELLALTGNGTLNLPERQCDVNLQIRVLQGWKGDPQLVSMLTSTAIPLRVYGPWEGLNYQLNVDQLLRKRLEDEVKKRLKEWERQTRER